MVENSKIEWTDHTFNPWIGCAKVSPGCEHCYAETLMDTRYGRVEWGINGTRVRTSEINWRKPLSWNRKAEKEGVRFRVFCASLADVFENRNELIPWRQQLFHLISQTPHLDWLVLTKRPENVPHFGFQQQLWWPSESFPRNVWIGTSVENQEQADKRIPELLKIPAAVRFLSCEPLLGPVDLHKAGWNGHNFDPDFAVEIDWVIVGGESGQDARPMHPDWVGSMRDRCQAAGVAFFFKQWGEWIPWGQIGNRSLPCSEETVVPDEYFGGCDAFKVGKKLAGRSLDGREWSEFPVGELP